MSLIDARYNDCCMFAQDIQEHLPVLKQYSLECSHITELGVRAIVSTWAFLAARPKRLVSVDIYHPSFYGGNLDEVYQVCKEEGIDFEFIQKSDLEIELEQTDLLFIDTIHLLDQITAELAMHGNKANKYIIIHDTESCKEEMYRPIVNFLFVNQNWYLEKELTNNNGLTILKRL
jgi:hypothetical protein